MNLEHIHHAIAPLRQRLLDHPLYRDLHSTQALQVFMQHHVFAVWDFMSLLKSLQRQLSCVTVPWLPAAEPAFSRMINEIVLGEETDEDGQGGYCSHFVLYHRAMTRFGASTEQIDQLLSRLNSGTPLMLALKLVPMPECVRQFVNGTFEEIERGEICRIAAAFTWGREDLLPSVFQRIVDELSRQSSGRLDVFQYYLRRHVELDGDEHGPMSERMMARLCEDHPDRWKAAIDAACTALQSRIVLWDGIHAAIQAQASAAD